MARKTHVAEKHGEIILLLGQMWFHFCKPHTHHRHDITVCTPLRLLHKSIPVFRTPSHRRKTQGRPDTPSRSNHIQAWSGSYRMKHGYNMRTKSPSSRKLYAALRAWRGATSSLPTMGEVDLRISERATIAKLVSHRKQEPEMIQINDIKQRD
jgi:hypothetical protein